MRKNTLELSQARRIALAAQGFSARHPKAAISRPHLARTLRQLGLFQIDSVNIVARAHYMPLFSRTGSYDTALIDQAIVKKPSLGFEYWAHEASLLPVKTQPFLRWRMAKAQEGHGIYKGLADFGRERRAFINQVLAEVERRGPVTAADIDGHRGTSGWWGWSEAKRALEWLFWAGLITTHSRGTNFERRYDIPERVLPAGIIALPTPTPHEAQRQLLEIAARALGVATRSDLRDYFRLSQNDTYPRIDELIEEGVLQPVEVSGWPQTAYLHREAKLPKQIKANALLAPFDPLVWERSRTERLFDFRYRLEIYTPAHKRVHGYYVFPFLLDERIVARVDLKADRKTGVLRILGAFDEPAAPPDTPARLVQSLQEMAAWLDLTQMEILSDSNEFSKKLKAAAEIAYKGQ